MKYLLATALILATVGCSTQNDDKSRADDKNLYPVPKDKGAYPPSADLQTDLPPCNDKNAETIFYVAAEKANFVCRNGEWENIGNLGL